MSNRIFRVVWNALKRCYVAVNEKTGTAQSRGSALIKAAVLVTAGAAAMSAQAVVTTTDDFYVGNPEEQIGSQPGYKTMVPNYVENQQYVEGDLNDTTIAGTASRVFVGNYHELILSGGEAGQIDLSGVTDMFAIASGRIEIQNAINGIAGGVKPNIYVGMTREGGPTENGELHILNSKLDIGRLYTAKVVTISEHSKLNVTNGIRLGSSAGAQSSYIDNRGELVTTSIEQNVGESGPLSVLNSGTLKVTGTWDSNAFLKNTGSVEVGELTLRAGRDALVEGDVSEWSENSGTLQAGKFTVVKATEYGNGAVINGKFRNTDEGTVTVGAAEDKTGEFLVDGDYLNEGETRVFGRAEVTENGNLVMTDGSLLAVSGQFDLKGKATLEGTLEAGSLTIANSVWEPVLDSDARRVADITVNNGTLKVGSTFDIKGDEGAAGSFENKAGRTLTVGTEGGTSGLLKVDGEFRNRGEAVVYGNATVGETGYFSSNTGGVTEVTGKLAVGGSAVVREGSTLKAGRFEIESSAANRVSISGRVEADEFAYEGSFDLADSGVIDANKLVALNGTNASFGGRLGTVYAKEAEGNVFVMADRFVVKEGGQYDVGNGGLWANTIEVEENGSLTNRFNSRSDGHQVDVKLADGAMLIVTGIHGGTGDRPAEGELPAYTDYTKIDSIESHGGSIIFEDAWQDGVRTIGKIAEGSTFGTVTIVGGIGNENGGQKGFNLDVNVESGDWFSNTYVEYQNGSTDLFELKDRGENNKYLLSRNSFMEEHGETANYLLQTAGVGTNSYTVINGSTLKVGSVELGNEDAGRIFVSKGSLELGLDQLFADVNRDGVLTGTDMADGSVVMIPLGGIQSVGALKDGVTDLIRTSAQGNIAFTDTGWTQASLRDVTQKLTNAYGEVGTITFLSGESEFESEGFTVATANSLSTVNTHGLIFADTELVNRVSSDDTATKLTFGTEDAAEGNTVKGDFGFKSIAKASDVTVEGGRTLYLVGYTEDGGNTALLPDAEGGGTVTVKNGTLVLGGASAGTTYGTLGTADLADAEALLKVQNGVFTITDDVKGVEGSMLNIAQGSTLLVDSLTNFAGSLVNEGKLQAAGDVTLADAVNRGAIFADGTLRLTASEGETGRNEGFLAGTVGTELTGSWVNAGTVNNLDEEGYVKQTGGTFENRGFIAAKTAEFDRLVNAADIVTAESMSAVNVTNEDSGSIQAKSLSSEGFISNKGTISFTEAVTAEGEIVNERLIEAASVSTSDALTNSGRIEAESVSATGNFVNSGTVSAGSVSAGTIENSSSIETATLTATDGNVTNLKGARITVTGEAGMTLTKLDNAGTVKMIGNLTADEFINRATAALETDGVIVLSNAFTNEGGVTAKGMTLVGAFVNKRSVKLTGEDAFSAETLDNTGTFELAGSLEAGTLENGKEGVIKVAHVTAGAGGLANDGRIETGSVTSEGTLANAGTIAAQGAVEAIGTLEENSGTIRAASLKADGIFNTGTIELTGLIDAGTDHTLENRGTITASAISAAGLANTGTITLTAADAAYTVTDDEAFLNKGTLAGLKTFTVEDDTDNLGTISAKTVAVSDGVILTNAEGAKLSADTLTVDGLLANSGEVTVKSTTIGENGVLAQTEKAIFTTDDMTVKNAEYTQAAGTVVVKNGIRFTAEGRKTVNVTEGSELVLGSAELSETDVNVTKRLTFGTEHGIADKVAAENADFASKLSGATGVLTVQKAVKIGEGSHLNIGSAPAAAVSTFALRAAAPRASVPANLNAAAGSFTLIDAGALNGAAAFEAGAAGLTAVIDPTASLVVTRVEHDGDLTVLKGFDLSANLTDGVWTGGWSGDGAIFVNDGSGLDYDIETRYENGNLIASLTMADVSTVYTGLAADDLANVALKNRGDGQDVLFMRGVIRDRDMTVAEKTKIVNSVTQIASTVGAQANFLADVTALVGSVEERAGFANHEGTGLWVKVEGGRYAQDGLKLAGSGEAGYDTSAYGFTFGADHALKNDLTLGAAFSYLKGSADAEGDVLRADNDYETFGIQGYAVWTPSETARLIADVGYFRTSNEVNQTIGLEAFKTADADFDASAVTLGIRAEGQFDVDGVKFIPHAGLRGIFTMNDRFTTKIDGKAAFENDIDDTFTVQMPVGVTAEKTFDVADGWKVTPSADVTVTPQFGDTDGKVVVTGIGAEASQGLTAEIAGDVTIRTVFGLRAEKGNAEVSAKYAFTGGDAGRRDHAFTFGVSYRF